MNQHAFLSASGAPAWTRCEAKVWREKDLPEETSPYAEEGTLAHELLEKCIKHKKSANYFFDYSEDMQEQVQKTLNLVCELWEYGELHGEQRLDIGFITGEEGAQGTADVVIVKPEEIVIIDLKYGMGVAIEAEGNEQLLIYGAAALREFDLTGDVKTLRMIISQPRLNHTTEWILNRDEVADLVEIIKDKAQRILAAEGGDTYLLASPGDKQCRFCKVKGTCQEYRGFALAVVADDFVNLDKEEEFLRKVADAELRVVSSDDKHLATCMGALDLIENWCSAVRKEVEKRLREDRFSDSRWKLVQGRTGNRKIGDVDDFISMAKEHGIPDEELYEKSLLSPAQLEKKHKKSNPVFWAKVEPLMYRPEGRHIVVPASDKRQGINLALDFQPIEDEEFVEALIGLNHKE